MDMIRDFALHVLARLNKLLACVDFLVLCIFLGIEITSTDKISLNAESLQTNIIRLYCFLLRLSLSNPAHPRLITPAYKIHNNLNRQIDTSPYRDAHRCTSILGHRETKQKKHDLESSVALYWPQWCLIHPLKYPTASEHQLHEI